MRAPHAFLCVLGVAAQLFFAANPAAAAEKYPSRPVHFVVGFTAGGPNDIVARILSEWLSDILASSSWSKTAPAREA